jgi:site-specific recombinase XerD
MSNHIISSHNELTEITPLEIAGQVANSHAETAVFADYLSRKSDNTIKTQQAALTLFADYLANVSIQGITADCLQHDPECWRGVTWGLVEGFVKWMLKEGFSIATVNNRLSAVKVYAKLATKAGVISAQDLALIKTVSGYSGKEAKRVNERREIQRVGEKKADHVTLPLNRRND